MLNLSERKKEAAAEKARRSGGGAQQAVVVELKEVMIADPNNRKGDVGADRAKAVLLHDAFGMAAGTEVTFHLRDKGQMSKERKPYTIFDLQKGSRKGTAERIGEEPTLVLENCYMDGRTGDLSAGWINVAKYDKNSEFSQALVGTIMVMAERKTKDGVAYQPRKIVYNDDATVFTDVDHLRQIAEAWLADDEQVTPMGVRPELLVRVIAKDPEAVKAGEVITSTIRRGYDKDTMTPHSGGQSFDEWLEFYKNSEEEGHRIVYDAVMSAGKTDDYVFEVMMVHTYKTGAESLPSANAGKALANKAFESFRTRVFNEDGERAVYAKTGDRVYHAGWAEGFMCVMRMDARGEPTPWFATNTMALSSFSPRGSSETLITPNLPAETRAYLEEVRAAEGNLLRDEILGNKKKSTNETSEDLADDEGIQMGEPDHAGGLTPV